MPTAVPPDDADDVRHRLIAILAGLGVEQEVVEKASPHHLLDILDVPRAGVFSPLTVEERLAVLDERTGRDWSANGTADEAVAEPESVEEWEDEEADVRPDAAGTAELIAILADLRSEIVALRLVMDALREDLADARRTPETAPLADAQVEPPPDAQVQPTDAQVQPTDADAEPPTDALPPAVEVAAPPEPSSPPASRPEPAATAPPTPPAAPVRPPVPPAARRSRRALYVVLGVLIGLVVVALLTGGIMLALAMGGALPRAWPALRPEVVVVF